MIIKRFIIQNFRSYYGEKVFEFQKGLNLILGANGDGKTTFYDALDFVLSDTTDRGNDVPLSSCVSAKMFHELGPGCAGIVRVSIEMLDNDNRDRMLERIIEVYKDLDGAMVIQKHEHNAYGAMAGGVRKKLLNARQLLQNEALFPSIIKKYSLFKGERSLNIFDDKTTLHNLITMFSDIKDLNPYKAFFKMADATSSNAVLAAQKKNRQNDVKATILLQERQKCEYRLSGYQKELEDLEESYSNTAAKLEAIEADLETIGLVSSIKEAIRSMQSEIEREKKSLNENYTYNLLDNLWILNGFSPVLEEFSDKMQSYSEKKEQLINLERSKRIKKKAEKEATAKAFEAIKKSLTDLPWYIPDVKTMQSMLHQERCLVCGREAKEGSEAYNHIKEHLEEAMEQLGMTKKTKQDNAEKVQPLFVNKNIESIHQMSIQLYQYGKNLNEITEEIENVNKKNQEIHERIQALHTKVDNKQNEVARILAQSGSGNDIGELSNNWLDIKHWYKDKEDASVRISRLIDTEIPKMKAEIKRITDDYKKVAGSAGAQEFIKINDFFKNMSSALVDAEERSLDEFLETLCMVANNYLAMLNVDDFTGIIRIYRDLRNAIKVKLEDRSGRLIENPNTSLNTTMHLSILFAISELCKGNYDGNEYPLILDAPTSSFDEGKDKTFYEVMNNKLSKQCIIVTKSYLYKDEAKGKFVTDDKGIARLQKEKKIPIYRIEKLEGFDKKDLTSIETIVRPLF
jgi:hypothetical protein